ncbi:MAG: tetratricopeptide repeat protein [Rhizobiaceae bacterium]|nr:tetratricopeptide repeat protein [Rhizobiaceae bacterium]
MTDDSFFREVQEEIRQDKAKALWDRYGALIIGLAVAVVLGTAGFVGYEYWREARSGSAGDAFAQALQLARDGKSDEALAAFKKIEDESHGAYPVLARMRAATVLSEKGDAKGAVAGFDAVAADRSIDASLRDIARIRAAYILVDSGAYNEVADRVEQLAVDTNPMRAAAREALALSAWKAGKGEDAMKLFRQIADDDAAPQDAQQRANLMIELLRGSGVKS